MTSTVPRVLIVEDTWAFRQGLLAGLSQFPSRASIVGAAANADEAVASVQADRPQLVLLDLRIPQSPAAPPRTETGLDLIRRLKADPVRPKVLVLSSHLASEPLFEALLAGANGYISKDDRFEAEELMDAIERIMDGEAFYGPEVAAILRQGMETAQAQGARPLSDRHQRVLEGRASGQTEREIAEALGEDERATGRYASEILAAARQYPSDIFDSRLDVAPPRWEP